MGNETIACYSFREGVCKIGESAKTAYILNDIDAETHHGSITVQANGGDLVCSFRHLDAIICLDRSAKEDQIRWILSGKGDQFNAADDHKTSAQHYATVEGDDKITVFDNGNGRNPQ